MRDQRGRAARQGVAATGRDSSRQDVHSSHRSQKAMLQPRVHHRRREASTSEGPGVPRLKHPCLSDNRVTFSPRQVSRPLTSGRRLSVKMWPRLCCPLTALMVFTQSAPLRSETPSDER